MLKNTWSDRTSFVMSTLGLACALFLLVSTSASAHERNNDRDNTVITFGPETTSDETSAAPIGDDDAPFIDGQGTSQPGGRTGKVERSLTEADEALSFTHRMVLWLRNYWGAWR